jgi:hypothetical protein
VRRTLHFLEGAFDCHEQRVVLSVLQDFASRELSHAIHNPDAGPTGLRLAGWIGVMEQHQSIGGKDGWPT